MSAPRDVASTSNFQLSLSLSENCEVAPPPPTPINPPRRPEVRPLPPSSTLRYETKLFEIEVMDRGLRWKRCTKKYPKLHLKDEVFNYMCRPFLDSHLIALDLLGCTEENKVLKLLTEGLSENSREIGAEIFNFEYRPNSPNKYRPFGNSIGTIRPYTPASKEEEEGDPRYLPCKHCTKPNRMMNSPAPRPDPIKFQFPAEFEDSIEVIENDPSDSISGPTSVSYTTRSGRSTRRLNLSPDQAPPTASTSGASMPPPPQPPGAEVRPTPAESPASSLGPEGPRPVTAEAVARTKRETRQGQVRREKKKERREVGASPGKAIMAQKARNVVGFNPKKAKKGGRGVRSGKPRTGSGFPPNQGEEEEDDDGYEDISDAEMEDEDRMMNSSC